MQHVVNFSGGKDSTAMLLMMIERGMAVDRVICVDMTKEFPQMYDHIKKVQYMIEPLQIEIVKIDFDYYFSEHIKTKGKRKGERGYGWPGHLSRWCTRLKINAINELIKQDDVQYIGFAYEERMRINETDKRNLKYPLCEWGITEKQALEYCYSKGLNWDGLYEKFSRVSCWCCPLSRIGELKILHKEFPALWLELEIMDKKQTRKYKMGKTVEELGIRFKKEDDEDAKA